MASEKKESEVRFAGLVLKLKSKTQKEISIHYLEIQVHYGANG